MARTRTHRPTPAPSPRYTRRHGIGRDRLRWDSSQLGTFRKSAPPVTVPTSAPTANGTGVGQ